MTIKVGDVVMLKSGGPRMTVRALTNEKFAECVWFPKSDVTKSETETFKLETLASVGAKSEPSGRDPSPADVG